MLPGMKQRVPVQPGRPNHRPPRTIWLCYNGILGDVDPFAIDLNAIVTSCGTMKTPIRRPSRRAAAVIADPSRLARGLAHRQVALERRNFLFKPQDPFIETLQRRRLSGLDHPVKLAQGPSPPCAGGRWRLYCSHIRSRKLSGHGVLARTNERDSHNSYP